MKVCVLGSNGFIGKNLIASHPDWIGVTRKEVDLTIQKDVDTFFEENRFDVVIHCAVIGGSRLQIDTAEVGYKNLLMFENVVRHLPKIGKLIYFSSGASKRGNPPSDPYGFSKWIIDKRIASLGDNVYSLCIWGCYGPGELESRFSAICKNKGHVLIQKDRYFDFVDVAKVVRVVEKYCNKGGQKFSNLVDQELGKLKLSDWATHFGATFTILEEGLGESYTS
jgi:nucleoside-diphosphate-sugar epimerase